MKKTPKQTKTIKTPTRRAARTERTTPNRPLALGNIAHKLGYHVFHLEDALRQRGVLYDAPDTIWHNMPTEALIKSGYFALMPVLVNGQVGLDYLKDVLDGAIEPGIATAPKGRTGLRLVGGSEGDVLFRLRTFEEYEKELFDVF